MHIMFRCLHTNYMRLCAQQARVCCFFKCKDVFLKMLTRSLETAFTCTALQEAVLQHKAESPWLTFFLALTETDLLYKKTEQH